ncbi:MAG: mechanosensitive ion channel protein MscL [Candidatus Woesearchaeota archaeon]|nr:MAG: mechanosensitive ion channel protein MscL [Candidatus Woesearchaeota archaeon]
MNFENYLEISLLGNTIKSYIIALIILILFIGLGKVFSFFIIKIMKKIASKTKTVLDDIIISIIEKPFVFGLFITGFYIAGNYLNLSEFSTKIYYRTIEIMIVILVIWTIIKLLDAIIEHYLLPVIEKSESQLDDQLLPFIKNTVKVIIIVIGAIFLIKDFGYDVTSLVAGLGIGGLAFALAAQPLLTNLFGGIAIIADKSFHIGDRIRIDDRYEGYVTQIGMRSTTLKSPIDTFINIPNSVIASSAIENKSRENKDHAIRFTLRIGIVYNTPSEKIKEAIQIIKNIFEEHPAVIKNDPVANYYVGFSEFADSSLILNAGYSIPPKEGISKVRTEINLAIKERFEKAGIEFAFPTQTIYLKKE